MERIRCCLRLPITKMAIDTIELWYFEKSRFPVTVKVFRILTGISFDIVTIKRIMEEEERSCFVTEG